MAETSFNTCFSLHSKADRLSSLGPGRTMLLIQNINVVHQELRNYALIDIQYFAILAIHNCPLHHPPARMGCDGNETNRFYILGSSQSLCQLVRMGPGQIIFSKPDVRRRPQQATRLLHLPLQNVKAR